MTRRTLLPLTLLLAAAAHAAERAPITVHVFDLAGAPDTAITQAIEVATRIYSHAGVSLRWVRQPASVANLANGRPFHHEETPAELSVWLLPKPAANANRAVAAVADTATNFEARYQVSVFYDRVQSGARAHPDVDLSSFLGLIVAHELGHLFLGPGSHQRNTLMTPRWEAADIRAFLRGQLSFTPDQAAALRANAAARLEKAKPAQVSRGGSAIPTEEALTSSSNYSRKQ